MLGEYAVFSALAATAYVTYILLKEDTLFGIIVHLFYAKVARLVFGNLILAICAWLISFVLSFTLGRVRDLEAQTMSEVGRNILLDTVIFLLMANPTVKEKEVPHTILVVSLCITISTKVIHLLSNGRVAHAAEPGPARNSLNRLLCLILLLLCLDVSAIRFLYPLASQHSTFYAWNLFEFATFLSNALHNLAKLAVIYVDHYLESNARVLSENPQDQPVGPVSWPWKTEHFFLIDTMKETMDLCLYIIFIGVFCLAAPTRLPFYLASDVFQVVKSLSGRLTSFYRYRKLLKVLDTGFANAPDDKLDETCIICRDLLSKGAKVLPCGHILHPHCLKSWFVAHQTCPTCRAQITFPKPPTKSARDDDLSPSSPQPDAPPNPAPRRVFAYPGERLRGNVSTIVNVPDVSAERQAVMQIIKDLREQLVEYSEAEEVSSEEEQAVSSEEEGEDLMGNTGFVAGEGDEDEDDDNGEDIGAELIDDENTFEDMTVEQRAAADRELRRREAADGSRNAGGGLRSVAAMFMHWGDTLTNEDREIDDDTCRVCRGRKTQDAQCGMCNLGRLGGVCINCGLCGVCSDEQQNDAQEYRRNVFKSIRERSIKLTRPQADIVLQARESLPECLPSLGALQFNERVGELISAIFESFLWEHKKEDEGPVDPNEESGDKTPMYMYSIQVMVRDERNSLSVDWEDLSAFEIKLVDWLTYAPCHVLGVMDDVATRIARSMFPKLYRNQVVCVRLKGRPILHSIRNLDTRHTNSLVCIEGVCIRRSNLIPRLSVVFFRCLKCGFDGIGPYNKSILDLSNHKGKGAITSGLTTTNGTTVINLACVECDNTKGFVICRERAVFINYQTIVLQELTSQVPPGNIPRQKTVIVVGDLVDKVRPGDEIIVSGVFETRQDVFANSKCAFPVFSVWIVANHLERRRERQLDELTENDFNIIRKLGKHPRIRQKIIKSIAPSIWGNLHAKTAIAMSLFGGVRRELAGGQHAIRGDVNVLIIGDPGMGKSQLLKFVAHTFPRTILTTGKGASGVGLTASVKRDHITGEWTLEGGAFVLADDGICLIDEFDKMNDQDRVSIHEAMEQQSISLSKAGIVATLRARCAVIAAANPIGGNYLTSLTLPQNVELSDPILSRFDVIAVVKDQVYPLADQYLADHVFNNHMQAHPDSEGNPALLAEDTDKIDETIVDGLPAWVTNEQRIPDKYLRQYVIYARQYVKPSFRPTDEARVKRFYSELRQATQRFAGSMPMTVRHLESVFRMAAANAKIRLSNVISSQDVDFAMSTVFESFVQTQKHSVAQALSKNYARYRALAVSPYEVLHDVLMTVVS